MKRILIAISLAFLLPQPVPAAVNLYGPGGMTCAVYSQSSDSDKAGFKYWAQGYLSGMNAIKNFDLSRGRDQATFLLGVDAYCRSNPQSSYAGAIDSLILEINK